MNFAGGSAYRCGAVMAHIMCSDICLYLFITCQKLSEFIWIYVRMFGVGRITGAVSSVVDL